MKLVLQRVSRATAEVDGYVTARIGSGLVVYVAVRPTDSLEQAQKLAAKVIKLNVWPDIADIEKPCCTNVVDNGFEVLVVFQQTLLASLAKNTPTQDGPEAIKKAKGIFEGFVAKLKELYQPDMVCEVAGDELRVEATAECPGIYELDTLEMAMHSRQTKAAALVTAEKELGSGEKLSPTVEAVTKALQRIPLLPKSKATLEASRVYAAFGTKLFRSALSEASSNEVDTFSEALESAGHFFTRAQQDKIASWTGVDISAAAREDDERQEELQEELEAKMAELYHGVKAEQEEEAALAKKQMVRQAADWTGRAAPATPGTTGRYVGRAPSTLNTKGKGKGKGRGIRSFGIASLDEAARIHGLSSADYHYGQLARISDKRFHFVKEEDGDEGTGAPKRKLGAAHAPPPLRLKKGTPTIAPMTPMPTKSARQDI